jgi:uncharacterized protein YigA (DUF484 family)
MKKHARLGELKKLVARQAETLRQANEMIEEQQQQRLAAAEAENEQLHHEISYYESLVDDDNETDWPHRDGRFRDWLQQRLQRLAAAEALLQEACQGMDLDQWDSWEERAKGACGDEYE